MYNAVGIDVSKGKSTVAVLQPGGTVIRKPFDVSHTSQNLHELAIDFHSPFKYFSTSRSNSETYSRSCFMRKASYSFSAFCNAAS